MTEALLTLGLKLKPLMPENHRMTNVVHPIVSLPAPGRLLTAAAYQRLADVPPELEWFANLGRKATRRAYEHALGDFMRFAGLVRPEEFRSVTRSHVIAWRDTHLLGAPASHGMSAFRNERWPRSRHPNAEQ